MSANEFPPLPTHTQKERRWGKICRTFPKILADSIKSTSTTTMYHGDVLAWIMETGKSSDRPSLFLRGEQDCVFFFTKHYLGFDESLEELLVLRLQDLVSPCHVC